MSRIEVVFVNESTVMTDAEIEPIVHALQVQVDHDFRPTWGVAANLSQLSKGSKPPADKFWLGIFDNSDQAGALGYHDLTPKGFPVSKVFAETDKQYGALVSVTCSHELLEMLGDPFIGDCVIDPSTGRLYAKENADAVEADELGYDIDGVKVSDFVLPQYFDPQHSGKGQPLSMKGNVSEPFYIAPGGYMSYMDLSNLGAGWQQVTDQGAPAARQVGQREPGFPLGSRRERRVRASKGELKVSEVAAS